MQAGINGYKVNEYEDTGLNNKGCNDKRRNGSDSTVEKGSLPPALVDEEFNCLGKESNSSPQARLSVGVPRGVYKQLKLLAHDRDMTISALLVQLIKAEIQSLDTMDL
jgi:hypothetical protein